MKQRIKELRLSKGMTLLEVANKLGVSEGTVQRYESGNIRNLKYDTIVKLSNIFGCSPAYLMGWDDSPTQAKPVYEAAAGTGRIGDGSPTGETKGIMLEADQVFVTVKGRSMEPTLMDGDIVIVSASNVVEHSGQIALVKINGDEATLKRVELKKDGLTLIGDNVAVYAPHFFTAEEVQNLPVTIEGIVVKLVREL